MDTQNNQKPGQLKTGNLPKVFIVGHEGTTGLRIHERLALREDIELLAIGEEKRKDMAEITKIASQADVVFLCLPDAASKEVVAATKDLNCKIIDTSTAFRTHSDWAYGFPELGSSYRDKIKNSKYIAVPGCHASGIISILQPLVSEGLVPADYPISAFSLTGYSGGGKKMIQQYEADNLPNEFEAPRQYGLGQQHKHLKEVVHICGLAQPPIFAPIVDNYYSGMEVSIGFQTKFLHLPGQAKETELEETETKNSMVGVQSIWNILYKQYQDSPIVQVAPLNLEMTNTEFLNANKKTGFDGLTLLVSGNTERVMVHAIFDNLGKGASGAAVQCMNISLGFEETRGLKL